MSPNKRIALNVIATYGRSLYAFACGLFTGRWALMALGQEDYGLYGVVGGMLAFVVFLNTLMASSVGRFYAYSVGQAKNNESQGGGVCDTQRWFNTALMIHSVLSIVLVIIGYPIGIWLVKNFLTIPADRVTDCMWVWRLVCLSGFVSMINVPFQAMYTAKQELVELTLYSLISTTLNVVCLYYMVNHPRHWLVGYSIAMCCIAIIPQILICVRAIIIYPECRINRLYLWDLTRVKALFAFAGGRFIGALSQIASNQGMSIIVNKFLGPTRNASMTIGNTVSSQSMTLSSSFIAAFYPAITNAVGEGRIDYAKRLAYRICMISSISMLVFVLPLAAEIDMILTLWLKNPPPLVGEFCLILFATMILERLVEGHWMSLLAFGKIAEFQFYDSLAYFSALVLAVCGMILGGDLLIVGWSLLIAKILSVVVKLYFAKRDAGLSIRYWARHVCKPLGVASMLSMAAAYYSVQIFQPSLIRVCITTFATELVFLPLIWVFALDKEDRSYILSKLPFISR